MKIKSVFLLLASLSLSACSTDSSEPNLIDYAVVVGVTLAGGDATDYIEARSGESYSSTNSSSGSSYSSDSSNVEVRDCAGVDYRPSEGIGCTNGKLHSVVCRNGCPSRRPSRAIE